MVFGPEILMLNAALILAGAGASTATEGCTVRDAPAITVKIQTEEIDYDYSRSAKALGVMKTDSISPYAPGADTVSGGLREDHPEIRSKISWQLMHEPRRKIGCLSYDTIDIIIHLAPKIYVAKEFNTGACREAILQHERRHVEVDRRVMNKYGASIGRAVQAAVNAAGAIGPFKLADQEKIKAMSSRHIESALNSQQLLMEQEMRVLQGQVDSLEEYNRVSAQCRDIKLPK
ncbi:MAG: hypothetical protein ACXW4B_10665 [Micavibrio sp.]